MVRCVLPGETKACMMRLEHWFNTTVCIPHPNILKGYYILPSKTHDNGFEYYFEPISGTMRSLLHKNHFTVGDAINLVGQSGIVSNITRQYIEVLDYLHNIRGLYHGELSFENDFYFAEEGHHVVKMANMRERGGKNLEALQGEDWKALGRELQKFIDSLKPHEDMDDLFRLPLKELCNFLKCVEPNKLENLKAKVLEYSFFATPAMRIDFMILELPTLLKKPEFRDRVNSCVDMYDMNSSRWDELFSDIVLNKAFNRKNKNSENELYDWQKNNGLLNFVSALYTHFPELKIKRHFEPYKGVDYLGRGGIDKYVTSLFPRLFHRVKTIANELQC